MPDDTVLSGRYRLGALLGGGGMADVYAAVDERLGRDVAVKLFRGAGDERHQAEVQVLGALNHPNLVQIYDADLGRPAYVVMELVDGRSLDVLLRTGARLDVGAVGAGVAAGLAYAHGQGVVHRDVKPGNVIVATDGRVKLADFGIARLVDQAHLTATGQLMGTAAYLAPEQARGQALTGAADVYSLGLVLLECVTGRREYDGNATEAAVARLSRPPAIPASAPYARLLAAMTETDPALRPTAAAVAAELSGGEPATVALARPAPQTRVLPTVVTPEPLQRKGSAWPWVLAAVLVVLAAIGGIVAYALHDASVNDRTTTPTQSTAPASSPTPTSPTSQAPTTPTSTSSSPTPTETTPTSTATTPSTSTSAPTSSSGATTSTSAGGVSITVPGASVATATGGATP